MKKIKKQRSIITLLIAVAVFMTSCAQGSSSGTEHTAGSSMKVEYSKQFSVQYLEDGVKLVTDAESRKLLLVPREQEAPSGYDDAAVIKTPVQRALFCSVTQVGMIRPYGIWDNIAGIVTGQGGFAGLDEDVKASGADIKYVGGTAVNYEAIQEMNPDIAFVYTGRSAQTEIIAKLEELGIPYAVDNEYTEPSYFARLEWTKFLATFFDKDDEAVKFFDSKIKLHEDMEKKVANAPKPKIGWGMLHPATGVVYVAGNESFVGAQIRAAGCTYVFAEIVAGTGSGQLSIEQFYTALLEAEILIYSSNKNYMPSYEALLEAMPILADCPAVKNKQVWQFDVDYYYYTDQAIEQVVELAAIFHPDLYPNYKHVHYHPLAD